MARFAGFIVAATVALLVLIPAAEAQIGIGYGFGPGSGYFGGYTGGVGFYAGSSPYVMSGYYGGGYSGGYYATGYAPNLVYYGPTYAPVDVYYGPPPVYVAPAYGVGYAGWGYGFGPYREKIVVRPHSYKHKVRW